MIKVLLGLLALSQLSLALPLAMKVCNPDVKYVSSLQIAKDKLVIDLSGIDQAGKPFQGQGDYPVLGTVDFTAADFSSEDIAAIHSIAGISSFANGTLVQVGMGNSEKSSFFFFEFAPSQYSVVWIVQGYPVPLGKTNTCQ